MSAQSSPYDIYVIHLPATGQNRGVFAHDGQYFPYSISPFFPADAFHHLIAVLLYAQDPCSTCCRNPRESGGLEYEIIGADALFCTEVMFSKGPGLGMFGPGWTCRPCKISVATASQNYAFSRRFGLFRCAATEKGRFRAEDRFFCKDDAIF